MASHRLTWGGEPLFWDGAPLFWGHDNETHGGGHRPKKHGGWGRAPTRKPPGLRLEDEDDLLVLLML